MIVVLVIYDISDDGKRIRVARLLQRWGLTRIQRSAFTGLLTPSRLRDLEREIRRHVDEDTDVVHIVPVPRGSWERKRVIGTPWGEARVQGATVL